LISSQDIRNVKNLPFSQTVNFKYADKYGEQFCKSLILNKPRLIKFDQQRYQILISAVSYFEYPIKYSFYLIEGNESGYRHRSLEIVDQKPIHY